MNALEKFIENNLARELNNSSDARTLKISVLLYLQAAFVSIVFVPFHYFLAGIELISMSIMVAVAAGVSFLLVKFNLTTVSKFFFITVCNLAILFNTRLATFHSNIHLFLGVTISLPFFMFSTKKNKFEVWYAILLPIIIALTLAFTDFPQIGPAVLNRQFLPYYSGVSTILSMGMLAYTIYYFHSNSEKRENEILIKNQMIFQNEKMVSLGILSSGIAHEINNPLTVIKMSVDSIKKHQETIEKEPLLLNEKLEKIDANIHRIGKIVYSLKTYSRNEEVDPLSNIDLSKVVDEAVTLLTKEFALFNVDIQIAKTSAYAMAREGELIQVFVNLLINSLDAIKNSKNERWVKVEIFDLNNKVKILFIDSGKGISKEVADKIFQPFYTTKNIGEGTGLGLYISHNLITAMGGELYYSLQDGQTAFTVLLNKQSQLNTLTN